MSQLRREEMMPAAQWSELTEELDRWKEEGRIASLWWRDDDAAGPSARLDRLLSVSGDIPVALAVVPATADARLAEWLLQPSRSRQAARVFVFQHGWRHESHTVDGKKSEFPAGRSRGAVASDLVAGRMRLMAMFEAGALPVLAPPWNRFDCNFLSLLAGCGLKGISCAGPRRSVRPAPGIVAANVHVDLVAWVRNREFIGEEAALRGIVGHLRARRTKKVDAREPTGILTHHLVQDEATDTFLLKLSAVTAAHRAARWLDATEVFAESDCCQL